MDIIKYAFFQYAIMGSLLASIACGIIGTYIVTKRLVFISGGLTHSSLGGIGIGLYSGVSPLFCAAIFSILSGFGVEWLTKKKEIREDSAIAVFWTFGMAVGVIFTFMGRGFTPELSTFLFGNILTISKGDLIFIGTLAAVLALFFKLFINPIKIIAFDREYAKTQHLPVEFFEYALMIFIALTIVACLHMIGIVLVISLLTVPQMTANLFSNNFSKIILLSILIGFIGCMGGLVLSYLLRVPSGASIIFFSIIIYVLCKSYILIRNRNKHTI